jgi:hypothetical protein
VAFLFCPSVLQANLVSKLMVWKLPSLTKGIRVLGSEILLPNNLECMDVFILSLHSQISLSLIPDCSQSF